MLELLNFLNHVHPVTPATQHLLGQILRKKNCEKISYGYRKVAFATKLHLLKQG